MVPQFTSGVFNQRLWPKAGDVDDCWCIADLMVVHGCAPWLRLPNVPKYRAAAGKPDSPGKADPGGILDSARAIGALYKDLAIEVMESGLWEDFIAKVKAGHAASLSVLSGSLPPALQFGFAGPHRVAVFWNGTELRLANPLARAHSRSRAIAEEDLHKAVRDHPASHVNCVLMPTVEEAFKTHPLLQGAIDTAIDTIDDGTDDTP